MAKIITIRYSQDRTINLGNYQSVKVGYGMTAELDEDDDSSEVVQHLKTEVEELVEDEVAAWKDDIRARNTNKRRR